jgi:hypothetical protein
MRLMAEGQQQERLNEPYRCADKANAGLNKAEPFCRPFYTVLIMSLRFVCNQLYSLV